MASVRKMMLHAPSLDEVATVLQKGLASNFNTAEVKVTDCPDLTAAPFFLADKGLCGGTRIVDVGGPDFLKPFPNKDKNYTFANISELSEAPGSFLIGAGAGPHHNVGVNCELICNTKLGDNATNLTKIVKVVEKDGSYQLQDETSGEFSLLGNFFISQAKPGKVLEIKAENRSGPLDFVACIHKTLKDHYGVKAVGLGGTFLLKSGKANIHVMPDFSPTALETDEETDNWLNFYQMDAPLIHVGEVVSADPEQLHLRQEHFHCFSKHGQGGHYHFDTTPQEAAYLAYFNVADVLYRVDLPEARKFVF